MKIENFSFILGITLGAVSVLLLAYMFQDKIASWYARRYPAKLGERVEEALEVVLPGIEIKLPELYHPQFN